MTVLYSVAAASALIRAIQAAFRTLRDRSLTLVAFALSMTALSASLAVVAASPAVLQAAGSGPALWISCGLGVTATWAFAGTLSAANGGHLRFADMVMTPVLGGASLSLLLLGMQIADGSGAHQATRSGLAVIGTQLSLLTYCGPGLSRIASFAHREAHSAHEHYVRAGMRAVSVSAGAGLVLMFARSALIVAHSCGIRATGPAMTAIAVLLGCVVIHGTVGMTAGPVITQISSQCRLWLAYWQLRPLWAVLMQAVPHVELPAMQGSRLRIRWRLLRRVIEIRDAELALRPYWRLDVAARASAAASSDALDPELQAAAVEAAVVMDAAGACLRGTPPSREPVHENIWPVADDDLHSEIARLVNVSRVIRRRPVLRDYGPTQPHRGGA
jgi:hypothetical protein